MSNVKQLHNNVLYKVTLDVTKRYVIFMDAITKDHLDKDVSSVVNDDTYSMYTDYTPEVINYSYTSDYVSCEQAFEDFKYDQNNKSD